MQLTGLTELLRESRAYRQAVAAIQAEDKTFNVIRSARPFLLSALALDWSAPVIFLTARVKRAYNVTEQLPVWLDDNTSIFRFAEPAPQFYERSLWSENTIRSRIETLSALISADQIENHDPVVVA